MYCRHLVMTPFLGSITNRNRESISKLNAELDLTCSVIDFEQRSTLVQPLRFLVPIPTFCSARRDRRCRCCQGFDGLEQRRLDIHPPSSQGEQTYGNCEM
jgi:hypothetical protein